MKVSVSIGIEVEAYERNNANDARMLGRKERSPPYNKRFAFICVGRDTQLSFRGNSIKKST